MTIVCAIGAVVSMITALWLTIILRNIDDLDSYNLEQAINTLFCKDNNILYFFDKDSLPSAILVSLVTVGLFVCYVVLIYNIRRYYKGKLVKEMCRLRILYAIFFLCYGLRTVYQFGLGKWRQVPLFSD